MSFLMNLFSCTLSYLEIVQQCNVFAYTTFVLGLLTLKEKWEWQVFNFARNQNFNKLNHVLNTIFIIHFINFTLFNLNNANINYHLQLKKPYIKNKLHFQRFSWEMCRILCSCIEESIHLLPFCHCVSLIVLLFQICWQIKQCFGLVLV